MYLGQLTDEDLTKLVREFGLECDAHPEIRSFENTAAARSLKRIVAEDPKRAALFRKHAKWLNEWLEKVNLDNSDAEPIPNPI
jgi:hypothetical protein